MSKDPKKCLPYGWIVLTSKTYPDRNYYFNTRTNASSWEQPTLVSQTEYRASIPPPELVNKQKTTVQTASFKTPTKKTSNSSLESSGFVEDGEFSPALYTDSDGPFQSDTETDSENKPALTDFQKQLLEDEELKSQEESTQETESVTFSLFGSLKHLRNQNEGSPNSKTSIPKSNKAGSSHSRHNDTTFSLADTLKSIRQSSNNSSPDSAQRKKGLKRKSSDNTHTPGITFSCSDTLSALRQSSSDEAELHRTNKRSPRQYTQSPKPVKSSSQKQSSMTFSLSDTLHQLKDNKKFKSASLPKKTVYNLNLNKSSSTCNIDYSLPKEFKQSKNLHSFDRRNTRFKKKPQRCDNITNKPEPKLTEKRRGIQSIDKTDSNVIQVSVHDRLSYSSPKKSLLSTNDLRLKLIEKKDEGQGQPENDPYDDTDDLPAPKKREIQTWINNISNSDPPPPTCDFPPSPVSKTSSKEEETTGNQDRRVVLSSEPLPNDSSCGVLTLNTTTPDVIHVIGPETPVTVDEEEEMEIDDDAEEMMIIDLQEVREEVGAFPELAVGQLTKQDTYQAQITVKDFRNQSLYIIIDTNILIQSLKFLQNLTETILDSFGLPHIVIPWVVMQELDFIKDGKSKHTVNHLTKLKSVQAVKHLFSCLSKKHPRVMGQTAAESRQTVDGLLIECNDDRVLQCCLRYSYKYPNACIVLLSDDLNLCSKATISQIHAFTKHDILEELKVIAENNKNKPLRRKVESKSNVLNEVSISNISSPRSSNIELSTLYKDNIQSTSDNQPTEKCNLSQFDQRHIVDELLCEIKEEIKRSLSVLLETEMKLAFGNIWECVVLRKPPWSALDIMESIQKHWMAVFGLILDRRKQSVVIDIVNKLKSKSAISMKLEEVKSLIYNLLEFLEECETRQDYGGVLKVSKAKLQILLTKCQTKTVTFVTPSKNTVYNVTPSKNVTTSSNCSSELNSTTSKITEEDLLESVQDRFQVIWSNIFNCSDNLANLDNPTSVLSVIIPIITELRHHFAFCLSITEPEVYKHRNEFEHFTHSLNSFFSKLNIESPKPILSEATLCFFSNSSKREILVSGLAQLDEMIEKFHTFIQML